jgi:hypothetical protein
MRIAPIVSCWIASNTERYLIVGIHGQNGEISIDATPFNFFFLAIQTEHRSFFEIDAYRVWFGIE